MKPHSPKIFKLVQASLFLALTFLGTLASFPVGVMGNLNLGDGILLAGVSLLGIPGVIAGALGAMICDLVSGYAIYAPATLVIKLLMGFAAFVILYLFEKKAKFRKLSLLLSGIAAELVMVGGYYLFESIFLIGWIPALANIPFNLLQGGVAVILFFLLSGILGKWKNKV
ncbi:MAG: ECF transporter S component [Clostridia bacterium]|nr:ECF transporter S component [Clostridia bacterium]